MDFKPRPRKKSAPKTDAEFKIRQCPKCCATHIYAPVCPVCGFEYPVTERDISETKEARLERITETVRHYSKPAECKSHEELAAYGKMKGYKRGWVYYAAKELNLWR